MADTDTSAFEAQLKAETEDPDIPKPFTPRVDFTILQAKGFKGSSPYIIVDFLKDKNDSKQVVKLGKTQVMKKVANPKFNKAFSLTCDMVPFAHFFGINAAIRIQLWDKKLLEAFLGECYLVINELKNSDGSKSVKWINFEARQGKKDKVSGEVEVEILFQSVQVQVTNMKITGDKEIAQCAYLAEAYIACSEMKEWLAMDPTDLKAALGCKTPEYKKVPSLYVDELRGRVIYLVDDNKLKYMCRMDKKEGSNSLTVTLLSADVGSSPWDKDVFRGSLQGEYITGMWYKRNRLIVVPFDEDSIEAAGHWDQPVSKEETIFHLFNSEAYQQRIMKDEKVVANSPVLARFFRLIEDSVWEGKWTNKEEGKKLKYAVGFAKREGAKISGFHKYGKKRMPIVGRMDFDFTPVYEVVVEVDDEDEGGSEIVEEVIDEKYFQKTAKPSTTDVMITFWDDKYLLHGRLNYKAQEIELKIYDSCRPWDRAPWWDYEKLENLLDEDDVIGSCKLELA